MKGSYPCKQLFTLVVFERLWDSLQQPGARVHEHHMLAFITTVVHSDQQNFGLKGLNHLFPKLTFAAISPPSVWRQQEQLCSH